MKDRETEIVKILEKEKSLSIGSIHHLLVNKVSLATLKRILLRLLDQQLIIKTGKGKATRYQNSPFYKLFQTIDLNTYYSKEIDARQINDQFNFGLIRETLKNCSLFTESELEKLNQLHIRFTKNIAELPQVMYQKELERLAIDLSWKSSQIEGNTYSLLETERLLKDRQTASGKTKEEAIMLLNHKEAIDFIIAHPNYLNPLSVSKIEDIHHLLMKDLGVEKNIRRRKVGISGTNYLPLDNEFQIMEALSDMCTLVNSKQKVFEKALLLLMLISYIQPFADGNKRTARIVSNAFLVENHYCPLSFRTIDPLEYKKAMLVFYEQNNISSFKRIFIEQYTFAVNTYF
jgi:Fic family protein